MLKITIVTMGHKLPSWVNHAVQEYQKRLQDKYLLSLVEIPLITRSATSDITRIMEKERNSMALAIPKGAYQIALEIEGQSFSSENMAKKLSSIQNQTHHICFLVGGPEGLSPALSQQCQEAWSLSKLTLPHTLARIMLLESLYRAWAITQNHPYHK